MISEVSQDRSALRYERPETVHDLVEKLAVIDTLIAAYQERPADNVKRQRAQTSLREIEAKRQKIALHIDAEERTYEAQKRAEQRLRSAHAAIAHDTGGIDHDMIYPTMAADRIAFHMSPSAIDKRSAEIHSLIAVLEEDAHDARGSLESPLSLLRRKETLERFKQIIMTNNAKMTNYRTELDRLLYTKQILPTFLRRIEEDLEHLQAAMRAIEMTLAELYSPNSSLDHEYELAQELLLESQRNGWLIQSYALHEPHLIPPPNEARPIQWLWERALRLRVDFLHAHPDQTNDAINAELEIRRGATL